MKKVFQFRVIIALLLLMYVPSSAEIATGEGSCFKQEDKIASGGLSISYVGVYAAIDFGLHDLFSVGGVGGYNRHEFLSGWKYRKYCALGRVALHPLNFAFLADIIRIRDKVDMYGGIAAGYVLISSSWNGVTDPIGTPDESAIKIGEYLGIRYHFNDRWCIFAEDCGEVTNFALGLSYML
jgi:hypothetical protein